MTVLFDLSIPSPLFKDLTHCNITLMGEKNISPSALMRMLEQVPILESSTPSPKVLVSHYNNILSTTFNQLAALRTCAVTFMHPALWFTSTLYYTVWKQLGANYNASAGRQAWHCLHLPIKRVVHSTRRHLRKPGWITTPLSLAMATVGIELFFRLWINYYNLLTVFHWLLLQFAAFSFIFLMTK